MKRSISKFAWLAALLPALAASAWPSVASADNPKYFRLGNGSPMQIGQAGFLTTLARLTRLRRVTGHQLLMEFANDAVYADGHASANGTQSRILRVDSESPFMTADQIGRVDNPSVFAHDSPITSLDELPDGVWDADGEITPAGLRMFINRLTGHRDDDNTGWTPSILAFVRIAGPEHFFDDGINERVSHARQDPEDPANFLVPGVPLPVTAAGVEEATPVSLTRDAKRVRRTPVRPAARPTGDTTFRDNLRHDVIGQDEAIDVVVRTLNRARAGLGDPNRPRGSFLFAGPSGRGKSELGKAIAAHLGEGYVFRQFDMAEFSNEESVSRLFGGDPNYVGFDEGGELSNALADNPKTVVLFDEIEKAHPNVVNSLLGVIEDGNVRDGRDGGGRGQSKPRKATAREAVLILTTNAGRKVIGNRIAPGAFGGEDDSDLRRALAASGDFRPELVNRPDAVALFHDLTPEAVEQIAALRVEGVARRLASRNIHLQLTDRAKAWLAVRGFDADFGMRPLGRLVAREITDQVADGIAAGWIEEGDTVHLTFEGNDGLTVRTAREVAELDEYEHAIGTRTLGRTTRAAAQARMSAPRTVRTPRTGLLAAPRAGATTPRTRMTTPAARGTRGGR